LPRLGRARLRAGARAATVSALAARSLTPVTTQALAALVAPAFSATQTPTSLTYVEYFSGVGAGWSATTSSAFVTSLEATYASAGDSSASVTPLDFPVALGVTLQGVALHQFNSVPHLQDQVQAAIAKDAGGLNGTTQVTLGSFSTTAAGLYMPFTVDNLGPLPATAAGVVNALFSTGELVSTSSALSTTLATNGINCALSYAPPTAFPAGQAASPSTGVMLSITIDFPNATDASTGVAINMMDTGLLIQELTANGVTLGQLYGGAVVQVHTVTLAPEGGSPVPAYQGVFLASSDTANGGRPAHSAAPAAGARLRLALLAAAAALAACL